MCELDMCPYLARSHSTMLNGFPELQGPPLGTGEGAGALGARGVLEDPDLPEDVRAYLESVLKSYPDLDIHLLALARRGEPSEEGHEALTKAMRDLL